MRIFQALMKEAEQGVPRSLPVIGSKSSHIGLR